MGNTGNTLDRREEEIEEVSIGSQVRSKEDKVGNIRRG